MNQSTLTVEGLTTDPAARSWWRSFKQTLQRQPELIVFGALLVVLNLPVLAGSFSHSLIFMPEAVHQGEWWRLFTHPFVHVTWYHLLLDGSAFLMLYTSLVESSMWRRLALVTAGGVGGALISWLANPEVSTGGLCGLSGVAHGLMAVTALEMMAGRRPPSAEWYIGLASFVLVIGKATLEAISGHMFFTFLHFGLMGNPIAVSHAGGIIGSLIAAIFLLKLESKRACVSVPS